MFDALFQLGIFFAKTIILVVMILILVAGIMGLLSRGKEKVSGKLCIKNLNEDLAKTTELLSKEILSKKDFKQFLKKQKALKDSEKDNDKKNTLYVLNFSGDVKASAVTALREEVTAILAVASRRDEVVVRLESGGGMVHAYGLAAAQLQRFREKKIPLTICIDKIAASGGYMMASVGNKILAAPFSIIGSIGVIVQMPNFHRLLQDKHIDFEQLTAGNFKRTLTVFGQNTEAGREKLQEEIEEIHHLFKNLIQENRPELNIEKVATGEHWLAKQAIEFKLVDSLITSDDYLLEQSKNANVFEICYKTRKSFAERVTGTVSAIKKIFQPVDIYSF